MVWNQNPQQVDIIELRGDIQLDKIALLSRALNLKGLNSLAALSSNADTYESYKHFNDFPDMNPGAISPVSYTHLYVYKRQLIVLPSNFSHNNVTILNIFYLSINKSK